MEFKVNVGKFHMPLAHEGEWGSAEAMRLDDKSMPPRARASGG